MLRSFSRASQSLARFVAQDVGLPFTKRVMSRRTGIIWLITMGYVAIAAFLARSAGGLASIYWMVIYRPEDFHGLHDVIAYLRHLRTGIPPLLSLTEILIYQRTGNLHCVALYAYRIALVASYGLAIVLFSRSVWAALVSGILSVVFVWATVLIHPGNPQVYDVFFPLAILLYVLSVKLVEDPQARPRWFLLACSLSAGFFLSMAELLRPFMLLLMPVLIIYSYFGVRRAGRRAFLLFLLPIAIFSGGWHLKLLILNDGQLSWSNHTGYNLNRAWWDLVYAGHPLGSDQQMLPEAGPLQPGRWNNLDTEVHYRNGKVLQRAILRWMAAHPLRACVRIAHKLWKLLMKPETSLYNVQPRHPVLNAYGLLVPVSALFLCANLFFAFRRGSFAPTGMSARALVIVVAFTALITAIGEQGEEARFLLSLLPMMTALPKEFVRPPGPD